MLFLLYKEQEERHIFIILLLLLFCYFASNPKTPKEVVLPIKSWALFDLIMLISEKLKSIKGILNTEIFFHKYTGLYIAKIKDFFFQIFIVGFCSQHIYNSKSY